MRWRSVKAAHDDCKSLEQTRLHTRVYLTVYKEPEDDQDNLHECDDNSTDRMYPYSCGWTKRER